MMRKRDSKRRWKARYLAGQWIARETVENHSLGTFVVGCEWHHHSQMLRRPPQRKPRFDTVNAPLSELAQRARLR